MAAMTLFTATSAMPASAASPRVESNVPITGTDDRLQLGHNSPSLVADPDDARFVVVASRLDNPDFGCALQLSGDGGRSWIPVRPVPNLPAGTDKCYAPEVAFDRSGTLYYLFVGLQGGGNSPSGAFLVTSTDHGRTFGAPREVLGHERYMVRMAIDPTIGALGRLHLVWLATTSTPPLGGLGPPPNPILSAWSDDGGRTFSEPVQVSDPSRQRVVAPALALGPDHAVHVLYYDLGDDTRDYQGLEGPPWDGRWALVVAGSTNGGLTFTPGAVVDDDIVPPERVMLIYTMSPAALAVNGPHLYVGWTDGRNNDWDVLLRSSADGGRTWDTRHRLNDDSPDENRKQYLPHLSVAPGGRLDALFYDRRNDPNNVMTDVFLTSSPDGGRTFTPNLRLNDESFNSQIGTRYPLPAATGLVEFGSRTALLAGRDSTLAAWTDTRNQDIDGFGQDIFATEVIGTGGRDVPAAGDAGGDGVPTWLTWSVVVGAVALVGATVAGWRRRQTTDAPHLDPSGSSSPAGSSDTVASRSAPRGRSAQWRRWQAWPVGVSAVVVAASCGGGAALPGPPRAVDVEMREYGFDYKPTFKSGRTVIRAHNGGRLSHEMVLISLGPEVPPIQEQLRSANRQVVPTVANLHPRAPGQGGSIAVDLEPGRYAFVCFVKDPDGAQHAQKGMASEFRVK